MSEGGKTSYISYRETGKFQPIVTDYLDQDPFLTPFYQQFPSKENFREFISRKQQHPGDREILAEVIKYQYQASGIAGDKVNENIELLKAAATFTITTGQQTGILLGPLYAALKIISAINLSKQLKAYYPEFNFIPVFWMATEDHDVEEIRHVWVNNKKLSWNTTQTGAVGRFNNEGMDTVLKEVNLLTGKSKDALWLQDIFAKAYSLPTLSQATRLIVHGLFGNEGIVIIDPDDARLKKSFATVIEQDILEQHSFRAVENTREKLEKKYHSQVNGREINFFYLTATKRERLVKTKAGFSTHDGEISWTTDTLKEEIRKHPERFSPNVLMRPLYQETILPNLAYIGGGAEVAYWLEMKGIFDFYQVPFPALMLRNSAMIIDKVNSHRLENSGLQISDLFRNQDELEKEMALNHSSFDLLLPEEHRQIDELGKQLAVIASKTDQSLEGAAAALTKRLQQQVERFSKKLIRAEKRNTSEELTRFRLLLDHIYPGGSLQERRESVATLILSEGREVLKNLQKNLDPMENSFCVLHY